MAYSDSFPAVRPVFQADFANGGRIDPRANYTRSTTGTYFGTAKHLSSENLLANSNPNSSWTGGSFGGVTITADAASSPDGTTTASNVIENTATGTHRAISEFKTTSGATYTISAYLKANGRSIAWLHLNTAATGSVEFDLSGSGTATDRGGSPANLSISQIGSTGWYKCSFQTTASSTGTSYINLYLLNAANSTSYTGDGTSGVYAWGIQASSTGETVLNQTSGQIHREYAPTLQTAAINAPRFEYSATDGESAGTSLGILVEGQSTNQVTYSETLDTDWVKGRSTMTTNAAVAPSGGLTASLWTVDATAAISHNAYFEWTTGGATPQTASVYVKAGNVNYLIMRYSPLNGAFTDGYVSFNLSNGTVGTTTGTMTSSSIESCGNGWYRCNITSTALTNATGRLVLYIAQADNTLSFDGNSYDHLLITGAQIEVNQSFASSYIKSNSGSATTRAADSLSMVDSNLFDNGSGAVLVETGPVSTTSYPTPLTISDQTSSNLVRLQGNSTGTNMEFQCKADNSLIVQISKPFTASGTKLAASYNTNAFSFCADGGTVVSDSSGQLPEGLNKLHIGTDWNGSNTITGHIKRIAVYPALSDTNLQALTS